MFIFTDMFFCLFSLLYKYQIIKVFAIITCFLAALLFVYWILTKKYLLPDIRILMTGVVTSFITMKKLRNGKKYETQKRNYYIEILITVCVLCLTRLVLPKFHITNSYYYIIAIIVLIIVSFVLCISSSNFLKYHLCKRYNLCGSDMYDEENST